jgi:pantoate--beta-alanine ligase
MPQRRPARRPQARRRTARAGMRRARSAAAVRRALRPWRARGLSIAFVPTMGAIHEGHLSLVRRARASADRVVASVFVNPLQFGPGEDYRRYPRPARRDRRLLAAAGVDLLWEPSVAELYPRGERTRVRVTGLEDVMEGASRPGHFAGVATVVLKLLHVVEPDQLWLGQKDAQQARLIEQMCRDLLLPVRVRRGATVRERDRLAMSSRNAYLNPRERQAAAALPRALAAVRTALERGERSAARLASEVRRVWRRERGVREDYVAVVDADTLVPVRQVRRRVLVAVAARVGPARLIDNFEWQP